MSEPKLPSELEIAFIQNEQAEKIFQAMSKAQKKIIIQRAQSISTKHELKSFVNSIVNSIGF